APSTSTTTIRWPARPCTSTSKSSMCALPRRKNSSTGMRMPVTGTRTPDADGIASHALFPPSAGRAERSERARSARGGWLLFSRAAASPRRSAATPFVSQRYQDAGAVATEAGAAGITAGLSLAYCCSSAWKRGSWRIGSHIGSSHNSTGEQTVPMPGAVSALANSGAARLGIGLGGRHHDLRAINPIPGVVENLQRLGDGIQPRRGLPQLDLRVADVQPLGRQIDPLQHLELLAQHGQ